MAFDVTIPLHFLKSYCPLFGVFHFTIIWAISTFMPIFTTLIATSFEWLQGTFQSFFFVFCTSSMSLIAKSLSNQLSNPFKITLYSAGESFKTFMMSSSSEIINSLSISSISNHWSNLPDRFCHFWACYIQFNFHLDCHNLACCWHLVVSNFVFLVQEKLLVPLKFIFSYEFLQPAIPVRFLTRNHNDMNSFLLQ